MFKMIKTLNENKKLQQKVQILEKKVEGQKEFNKSQMAQNQKLKITTQQAVADKKTAVEQALKDKAWYQNEYIVEKHARQTLEVALEGQKKAVSKIQKRFNEKEKENERLKHLNVLLQKKINEKELTEKQLSEVE